MTEPTNEETEMTAEERLNYLRERGILVETAEDRRRQQIKDIMSETDVDPVDGTAYEDLKFVHVPHDETLPIKELSMKVPQTPSRLSAQSGDLLLDELKPFFSALAKANKVDMNLFRDQATKTFGSGDESSPTVSEETLQKVAEQGQVETFPLVHATESNAFTTVNIYLDEVGLLKRLPLNKRAADLAAKAGFNPPPQFYGDIFLGRVKNKPVLHNVDFRKDDVTSNTDWLKAATMENLEYQTQMNQITGRNELQPDVDGTNGMAKGEEGYSWTQTEEEIEIVVNLPNVTNSKEAKATGLKVKFLSKKLEVIFGGEKLLSLEYFSNVDPDGCTWTLDSNRDNVSLVITCEKAEEATWPRIAS